MKTPQLPVPELAKALGISSEVWLKREDKHHYGSHKGRSIPLMIARHRKDGARNFVISSSGNAAIAAIDAVEASNKNNPAEPISLTIFVGQRIDPKKIAIIEQKIAQSTAITCEQVPTPKQAAFHLGENGATLLRQSTDETALIGYEELANELAKIPELAAVFIPTSSGTTAEGLFVGFQKLGVAPQIHIVQTTFCHPIAEALGAVNGEPANDEPSLASAIVDKVALRKEKVVAAVTQSGGKGWIATNKDIEEAIALVKKTTGLTISPNSALSVVGLMQAQKNRQLPAGAVACLITGP